VTRREPAAASPRNDAIEEENRARDPPQRLFIDWYCDTANVHDTTFQSLIQSYEGRMVVFSDFGFHAKQGDPTNEWAN